MLILFEFWQSAILEGQKFWYDYEFIQICTEPVLSIAYNYHSNLDKHSSLFFAEL